MKTTISLLNDLITRQGLNSIEKLAQLIGISRQAVHKQLDGDSAMAPLQAVRVAELLDLPPLMVIAATQHEKAKEENERKTWERIYEQAQPQAKGAPRSRERE